MVDRTRSFVLVIASISMIASSPLHGEGKHHWSYGGSTGPTKWGSLERDYTMCGTGHMQSPIDIHDADAKKGALPAIEFDYKPSPLKIIDNGHTVQVDYAPGSSGKGRRA